MTAIEEAELVLLSLGTTPGQVLASFKRLRMLHLRNRSWRPKPWEMDSLWDKGPVPLAMQWAMGRQFDEWLVPVFLKHDYKLERVALHKPWHPSEYRYTVAMRTVAYRYDGNDLANHAELATPEPCAMLTLEWVRQGKPRRAAALRATPRRRPRRPS